MRFNVTLFSLTAVFATAAFAQETTPVETTPAPTQAAPTTQSPAPTAAINPSRGATMETVRAKFGAPSQEVPAVGKPPISRWEYPGYVVYFEGDRVLHTVVAK